MDPATGSNLVERVVTKFPLPGEPGLADRLESATLRFFLQQKVGTPAGPVSLLHSTSDNDLDRLASDFEDASYLDTELDLIQPSGRGQRVLRTGCDRPGAGRLCQRRRQPAERVPPAN